MSRISFLRKLVFLVTGMVLTTGITCMYGQQVPVKNLWEEGKNGYKSYHTPSLIVTTNGTLLAFAEGRVEPGDAGNIDLLLRRSFDNGKTWTGQQVVWSDGENTCGNPAPAVDRQTGRIWLFSTWNRGEDSEWEIIQKTSGCHFPMDKGETCMILPLSKLVFSC